MNTANKISILSTAALHKSAIAFAHKHCVDVGEINFIKTKFINTSAITAQIKNQLNKPIDVIFTSSNAVKAVASNMADNKPQWRIYCIQNKTWDSVKKYFTQSTIEATAPNALALSQKIIDAKNVNNLIFFCGNKRLNNLPQKLAEHNINFTEIKVYETEKINTVIKKEYDGILFFSPSAVESFFSTNSINGNTILFAIGPTTASAIKLYCPNIIITAQEPNKTDLLKQSVFYFKKTNQYKITHA